jgi:HD-GYP domain-containing protein (c-di-GMP phosphodiesterase class II)
MEKPTNFNLVKNNYFQIGDILDFDLYTAFNIEEQKVFLLKKGKELDENDLKNIHKFRFLYIDSNDLASYKDFILDKEVHSNSDDENFIVFSSKVYGEASQSIDNILHNPEKLDNLEKTEEIVSYLTDFILNEEFTLKSLLSIMEHDYYTHTHSINVSVYSLSFGHFLGMRETQLKELGISAVLHDLGKSKIDYNIINKNGKLDPEEFAQMKKHPEIGDYLAKNIGITNKDILSGIRHHHEKLLGTGYPDGLKGDEISLFAKIIGICDIFDALSTRRSYKDPLTTFESLQLMKQKMLGELDPHILNQFILMFKKQL